MIDDRARECLALAADTSLSGRRVAREPDGSIRLYGQSAAIVSHNGTKLTSRAILEWQNGTEVTSHYIVPGKPTQNAYAYFAFIWCFFAVSFRKAIISAPLCPRLSISLAQRSWAEAARAVHRRSASGDRVSMSAPRLTP